MNPFCYRSYPIVLAAQLDPCIVIAAWRVFRSWIGVLDEGGVSETLWIVSTSENGNSVEAFKLIKEVVGIHSLAVSSTNLYDFSMRNLGSRFTVWWQASLEIFLFWGLVFALLSRLDRVSPSLSSIQWTFWSWNLSSCSNAKASAHCIRGCGHLGALASSSLPMCSSTWSCRWGRSGYCFIYIVAGSMALPRLKEVCAPCCLL